MAAHFSASEGRSLLAGDGISPAIHPQTTVSSGLSASRSPARESRDSEGPKARNKIARGTAPGIHIEKAPRAEGPIHLLPLRPFLAALTGLSLLATTAFAGEAKKVTYEDDVLPILRDNCLKCHNPDKLKGDLDLSSFSSAMKGGGSGIDLNPGDPDGSQLYKSITHIDEPTMPPNKKIADRDIAVIRAWIEGGLLQGAGSKALVGSKPAADLALKKVEVGRPEGPPPMPGHLPLEPFVHATHGSALAAVVGSPWAPVVALAAAKQIAIYNTSNEEFIGVLPFADGFPCDAKFSRDGKLLVVGGGRGGQSGSVVVWDITTGERVITIGDQFDSVLAADISPDRQWIALGGPDRVLKIYRTQDGAVEHRIKKHTEWVTAVEFSPDGKYLATGDRNGGLFVWEAASGNELFTLNGHKAAITAITWRGDSEVVASASEDGTLKWWKAADGSAMRSITAHAGGVLAASYAHDGRIVSCGRDNKVHIWDGAGKNVRALTFSGDLPTRVSFSDDDKRVIGSDWKGTVFVWDAASGKVVGNFEANPPTLAERVKQCSERVAAAHQEIEKARTAKPALPPAKLSELRTKLSQAETALAKWSAAQREAQATATAGKVSIR